MSLKPPFFHTVDCLQHDANEPRLKLKRPQTAKAFRKELDDCYEEALSEEAAGKGKAKL